MWPTGSPVGSCTYGKETCGGTGQTGPCVGATAPATPDCSGTVPDRDCDGQPDVSKNCNCKADDTQPCYPVGTAGCTESTAIDPATGHYTYACTGTCKAGSQKCIYDPTDKSHTKTIWDKCDAPNPVVPAAIIDCSGTSNTLCKADGKVDNQRWSTSGCLPASVPGDPHGAACASQSCNGAGCTFIPVAAGSSAQTYFYDQDGDGYCSTTATSTPCQTVSYDANHRASCLGQDACEDPASKPAHLALGSPCTAASDCCPNAGHTTTCGGSKCCYALGSACSGAGSTGCCAGAYCNATSCVALLGSGSPCTNDFQCAGTLACVTTTGTALCGTKPTSCYNTGHSCTLGTAANCCSGLTCVRTGSGSAGTCQ